MSKQSKDIDRLYKFFDWDTLQHIKPRDSHKSFYSKARQVSNEAGELLISYDTPVAFKFADSGNIIRLWDKWSATTGRHLRAWHGIDKAQWMSMQVHPIDALCNTLEHMQAYTICDICGARLHIDEAWSDDAMTYSRLCCETCAGEHLTNCDDCGGYIDKRDAINDGDCIRCPRCYEKRVEAIA
jgi:hypothetical protein